MSDIQQLTDLVIKFRDDRDWKQFHNPKDMAISLSLEAGEFLELFQWKTQEEINEYVNNHREEISDELADVLLWVLTASHDLDIDIKQALINKVQKNAQKYPIEKAKGKHAKYTELT